MIKVIIGQKGTGKTKALIDMANKAVEDAKGHLVFVDSGRKKLFGLSHAVRFINVNEFGIKGYNQFYGFISGIIAENYDIDRIYIDGLQNIVSDDTAEIEKILLDLKKVANNFNIRFIITMNGDPDSVPANLKKYIA